MNVIKKYSDVDKIINKDLVLIIAKTHTCSACNTIMRTLETNVSYFDEVENYTIFVDDIDQFRGEYLIFSVPTVLIFSKGKELLRESRYMNYAKMDRLIEMFTK